ncbi:beta-ketoacyl-ACP synthase III [Desulfonatronum sp. SC1]|uniref:beta-ketoacyl-ACP synthase III n=1 Tax=Desulfonatronum sp. SC1 TaxID=2109626 RepID=UPI0018EEB877|nr:beta-ketoacyl-ACP synthase III [Desulfonatronum sp. SC1]
MTMSAHIIGTGAFAPERVVTNIDLQRFVDTNDEWIVSRTGIRERRIAEPGQSCSMLGVEAAKRALEDAKVAATDVTHVLVATFSPDAYIPSTAYILREKLGIPRGMAMDVSAACSGFLFALETARAFVALYPEAMVLVVGSEVISSRLNWEDRGTCVLFGDGAGAAVVTGKPSQGSAEVLDVLLDGDGSFSDLLVVRGGGSATPMKLGQTVSEDFFVQMQGREIFKHAVRSMAAICQQILEKNGLTPSDIDLVVPHQANIRIIESLAGRLDVPMDKVFVNIEKYGNTSAASIPLALAEAQEKALIPPGSKVMLTAFGGGLNWAAALLQY